MNKRNLQRELEERIRANEALGIRPRLLLHVCCAPCSSYCLEYLEQYFDITVFFYNPNIDREEEYRKRAEEEKRLLASMPFVHGVHFLEGKYDPQVFYQLIKGHEKDPEGGERCRICFTQRLREAAFVAKDLGMEYFTTSLTISPMKDAQLLWEIGNAAGEEFGVAYLPSDFKKKNGYKRSVELSRQYGLYRQDYCGCSFSRGNRPSLEEYTDGI